MAGIALILAALVAVYFVLWITGSNPVITVAGAICLIAGVFCVLATLGYVEVPGTDWFDHKAAAAAVAALI